MWFGRTRQVLWTCVRGQRQTWRKLKIRIKPSFQSRPVRQVSFSKQNFFFQWIFVRFQFSLEYKTVSSDTEGPWKRTFCIHFCPSNWSLFSELKKFLATFTAVSRRKKPFMQPFLAMICSSIQKTGSHGITGRDCVTSRGWRYVKSSFQLPSKIVLCVDVFPFIKRK